MANDPPRTMTRREPASGESAPVAGFLDVRRIWNSGQYTQTKTLQYRSHQGQTKGNGVTVYPLEFVEGAPRSGNRRAAWTTVRISTRSSSSR
jgi:hypothetical protein